MKKLKLLFKILIPITIILIITITATSQNQNTLLYTPTKIEGTIINERPITYMNGTYNGTLKLGLIGFPKTFNDIQANDTASINIINNLFIPLFIYDVDNNIWKVLPGEDSKGELGKGYEKNINESNELELTIYLRNDIYWTDKTKMTADDWVWYWNEIICNDNIMHPAYYNTMVRIDEWETKQIVFEKVSEYIFKIISPKPVAEIELLTNLQPMPKHIFKPLLDSNDIRELRIKWNNKTYPSNIVSNGAWILDEVNPDKIVLLKNENYFIQNLKTDNPNDTLPYLDKIVYYTSNNFYDKNTDTYYSAKQNEYRYFSNNIIDAMTVTENTMIEELLANQKLNESYEVWNGGAVSKFDVISFNQNPESSRLKSNGNLNLFSNKKFRKAISLLIDRDNILIDAYSGYGELNRSLIPEISPYFDKDNTFDTEYNPTKALKLLEELGIKDNNGDGLLEYNDKTFSFEILTNDIKTRKDSVEIIHNTLTKYGIDNIVLIKPFSIVIKKIYESDWDCVLIGLTGGLFPLTSENMYSSYGNMHIWYPEQWKPNTDWENQIDTLLNKAKTEIDFEKRKLLLNEMLSIMYEQTPIIPIVKKYSFLAVRKKFNNVCWDEWNNIGGYNYSSLYIDD